MARFDLKSFRGGKSDYDDRGISGSFKMGKNLNVRGTEDVLECNQGLTTDGNAASIVTDLILFFVNASDGNTYGFGDSGKIYKRTPSAVWSVVYTDPDGRITGAAEWYDSTSTYLVWATSTKLNRTVMPSNWTTDVNSGSWQKTNLTSSTWHTMAQGNGSLMICNVNKLAMVGYDSSYTNEAVRLRPGINSQTLIEYGNQILVGGGDGVRESWLQTWEQTALSWIGKNRIPAKTINAIVQAEVMLMSAGDSELFYSDMVNNIPVCALDGKANPGGVVEQGGLALFGLFGGSYPGIWSYGRKRKNEPHILNLEYYIDASEIGALCKIAGTIFVSYKKGSTYYVRKVDSSNKAQAEYHSLELEAPKESNFTSIELQTDVIPSGCAIECYYDIDATGSWTQAKMVGDVSQATTGQRDPIFLVGSYGRKINVKLVLIPNANLSPKIGEVFINFQ